MCVYLGNIYKEIFNERFVYGAGIEKRMQMQKTVYLLENMGLNVGNYNFIWYKHGPFSQRLQDDACKISGKALPDIKFTEHAQEIMQKMKEIVGLYNETDYTLPVWLEAVASLDFILTRKMMNDDDAIAELKRVKPHLASDKSNALALSVCKNLRAVVE